MKSNDMTVDVDAINNGMWVDNIPDCDDLRIKSRGLGNADYVALHSKLTRALPRAKRSDPEEGRKITIECLLKTCLQDWENYTDRDGAQIPVSQAGTYLRNPKYRPLVDAVIYAASYVSEQREADQADAEKNSPTA